MRVLIRAWESSFAGSWSLFALAALPGSLLSGWALIRMSGKLDSLDFAEWAFLTVATTVIGSISQLGLKPGYMQYVTDHGRDRRLPGLRAAASLMAGTGALAGLLLGLGFYIAHQFDIWKNTGLLPWLVPLMSIGNVTMMLHTDLRILGRSSVIALLAMVQLPMFAILLETCLVFSEHPLTGLYAATTLTSALFAITITFYAGIFKEKKNDLLFLKWAVSLGLPAMASLLSKYSADLTVSAGFRWLATQDHSGLYGFAAKLTEPLMGLYVASFQMAWGAFVYGWIKSDPSGEKVSGYARRSWWYAAGTLPAGGVLAGLIWHLSNTTYEFHAVAPFLFMCLSRAAAFGISTPMSFGQTMARNYRAGMKIHFLELCLTLTLVPVSLINFGAYWALAIAAITPWITVFLLYQYSRQIYRR